MESSLAETMGVRSASVAESLVNKSNLDNIVGSLWQQRQESSGSSLGNQSPGNGDDLSEGEADPGSPADSGNDISAKDDQENHNDQVMASDLRLPRENPFPGFPNFPHSMPGLPALEALHKQKELLNSSMNLGLLPPSSSPQGLLKTPQHMFPSHPGFPPIRPPSQPPTPSGNSNSSSDFSSQQNWSFEEQFKQLYEIDDNPKRKEFLDEIFHFMQKRGTPINRLPIMAKQVLDLYELYNLVIARGGLVEVINKKQWQEIIKGLGLPSSITSAAFTLRTQYTKYLYPYECKMANLSNPSELQNAIEGNKREGRTSSYHPYGMPGGPFQTSPLPPSLGGMPPLSLMSQMGMPPMGPGMQVSRPPMNGNRPPMPGSRSPPGLPTGPQDPLSAFEMTRLALLKMYNQNSGGDGIRPPISLPNMPNLPNFPMPPDMPGMHHQDKALNLHVERQRALDELRRKDEERENLLKKENERREAEDMERERTVRREMELKRERLQEEEDEEEEEAVSPPPSKRHLSGPEIVETPSRKEHKIHPGMPGTNIKITSRGEGTDSSLVVSMELNGQTFQGILFQKPTS